MKLSRVRTSPVRWLQGGRTEMITSIITFPRTGPEIKSQFCKTYAPIARAGKSGIATETVMFPYEIFHVSNSSTTPGRAPSMVGSCSLIGILQYKKTILLIEAIKNERNRVLL
ncbi:unnamed protein product [Caretta caretta]